MNTQEYFDKMDKEVHDIYNFVNDARKKGIDPDTKCEVIIAKDQAERVVGLISVVAPELTGSNIIPRIKELEKKYGTQDWRVALTIAHEVAINTFCTFEEKKKAMEVGIRVGIAYITNGVVSSPLEGFTRLEIKKKMVGNILPCIMQDQ